MDTSTRLGPRRGLGQSAVDTTERRELLGFRQAGWCIARMADGYLCDAPANVPDYEHGGLVCRAHAPIR